MYFRDRAEAGRLLAEKLASNDRYNGCVVMALCDGGVLVGREIADRLNGYLSLLLIEEIGIPGEGANFGSVNQEGGFTYNNSFSSAEQEEYYQEYHGYFEDQKREMMERIHRLIGNGSKLSAEALRDKVIILVSDGLSDGTPLDAAVNFLKPVRTERLIMATPLASVPAVDRMHILSDEIHVLSVVSNYLETTHYYDDNDIPKHEELITQLNAEALNSD